ncbi:MAG: iron-sulfur cluster assembly accessory protein [Prosthecobacter sp.]|jgi:iron-sulfur cluster assembly protein|nr:iron-sulfur cluster assembly accessory protein [Prosthecobacter sp.]
MMISLTDSAIHHLRLLLAEKQAPSKAGLRVRVEKGGCAGWQYQMKVDTPQEGDAVIERDGVTLLVDPESQIFLNNSSIDYYDSLSDSGFRVINPNAARNCGCGTSFEPKAA